MSHSATIYHTFEEWAESRVDLREARISWNRHIEKNGNVPIISKCAVCSGEEHKRDIKHGAFTPRRPSKRLRDEAREID